MSDILPALNELHENLKIKHGDPEQWGWGVVMRFNFNYYLPDDWYETLVSKLVNTNTTWCDVGCGKNIFPNNHPLAKKLSNRAATITGIDPDDNIDKNPFIDIKIKQQISDMNVYQEKLKFNLVTLRMVVEHLSNPDKAVLNISHITEKHGYVAIYTIHKWSPISIATYLSPSILIHKVKKLLFNASELDTFKVEYKMNTQRKINDTFHKNGFELLIYKELDDCSIFCKYKLLHFIELNVRKYTKKLGLKYPERNIIAIYKRI